MTQSQQPEHQLHQPVKWLPGTAQQQGTWLVAIGSGLWGMFWIPLRYLDNNGITGLWAVSLVMSLLIVPAIALLALTATLQTLRSTDNWIIGSAFALSIVLYFVGVISSDVIRVIFLFYLLPVWATLTARIFYKEAISSVRLLAIALALLGLWMLLGEGSGLPLPANVGDWCGLLAGLSWGVSLVLMRGKKNVDAIAVVATTAIGATIVATTIATLLLVVGHSSYSALPNLTSKPVVLISALGFSFMLLYPSLISQAWGAQRVPAPRAALLTMTEIVVATVSAYVLIGTELNGVAMLGALVILVAVLLDVIYGIVEDQQ